MEVTRWETDEGGDGLPPPKQPLPKILAAIAAAGGAAVAVAIWPSTMAAITTLILGLTLAAILLQAR
jgi:hypothetical protein